jgi:ribonuclease R
VEGIIHHHADGFAFVKPIVGQESEDLFVPPEEARKALDHDQVLVEVVPGRGGRTMGRIVEVKSRTRQFVIGTYLEGPRGAWVQPRERELGDIRVPTTQLARPGDLVKVRLGIGDSLFADRRLTGEVAGSLGSTEDHSVEVLSIAFARGFHDEFPVEVMDEADRIPLEVGEKEATGEHRKDLRELPLVTIDGEDARDFDDAIFVDDHPRGSRLVVAIADVAHYVGEHSALDVEALRRATSVYLPSRVLPMLPERLSNGICSLRPDVDRLCMVADLIIDRRGVTLSAEVYPAVMRSHARCTYTEVHQVLNGERVPGRDQLKPLFQRAHALATRLTAMRIERGAIDFDLPENRIELDERGQPLRMAQRERWESHRLVEECMLAANEAVARFFRERGLPTVNRFHDEPDEEKLDTFLGLLGAYGVEVKGALDSKELNRVLKKLEGHPEQRALHQLALRSMMQAVYSSQQSGHFGLGAEDYLHFTSPIRRYPDLLVHRLLKAFWKSKRRPSGPRLDDEVEHLEMLAVQCSERERAAMQVEREVTSLYACLLMKGRVGETFEATVGGLSEHGFFVVLDEHHVEGFVRGESVYPDFELDPATYRLHFGDGRVVRVGQKAKVVLLSVNLDKKQMEFGPLALDGEAIAEAPPRPPRSTERRAGGRSSPGPSRGQRRQPVGGGRPTPVRRAAASAPSPRRGPSTAASPATGFDPRAVLDRLWREKGNGTSPEEQPRGRHTRRKK